MSFATLLLAGLSFPVEATTIAPTSMRVPLGEIRGGWLESLAEIDGEALRVCRFFVPNQQTDPVQVHVEATLDWQPTSLLFKSTAKAVNAGAFTSTISLFNWQTNAFDPATIVTGPLTTTYSELETVAQGDVSRYVRANDRRIASLVRVRAVGPTTGLTWCSEFDQMVWEAVPLE